MPQDSENVSIEQADAFEALADLEIGYGDAAIVDYPWKFSCQNGTGRFEYRCRPPGGDDGEGVRDVEDDDAMFRMEDDARLPELLNLLADALSDGAWLFMMADDNFQDAVRDALKQHEAFVFRRNWAWTPQRAGMGYYGRVDHYPIPVATVGDTDRKPAPQSTLLEIPGGRDTDYPTGKPVALYRELVQPPILETGETLLEPFCGSAPGAAVARERGLNYWGCDVDAEAVELSKERLQQRSVTGWST